MRPRPFDESIGVDGDWSGRWIVHMLENNIEHRPCSPGEIGHQLCEFAIEVAKKQQCLLAQQGEPGIVNGTDRIVCPEQLRHQSGKLLRQRLCVRRRSHGKADGEMVLAHAGIPFALRDHAAIEHLVQNRGSDLANEEDPSCSSLRKNSMASFSLSVGGSFLCAFNSSQVAVSYFLITLSAAASNSMPCADAAPARNKAEIPTATPIDLLTLILLVMPATDEPSRLKESCCIQTFLFSTGAAILSTKATRAFGSAFSKSRAIFSFSGGGSAFKAFN